MLVEKVRTNVYKKGREEISVTYLVPSDRVRSDSVKSEIIISGWISRDMTKFIPFKLLEEILEQKGFKFQKQTSNKVKQYTDPNSRVPGLH